MSDRIEVGPGEYLRPCYTVEDWHHNLVVDRIFRSYGAAQRAMAKYLRRPDANEDVRIVTDYTS